MQPARTASNPDAASVPLSGGAAVSNPSRNNQVHTGSTRVCDKCITKKIKCDLGRPRCSRCRERGDTCTYSAYRRRPGPPRGTHSGPRRHSPSLGRSPPVTEAQNPSFCPVPSGDQPEEDSHARLPSFLARSIETQYSPATASSDSGLAHDVNSHAARSSQVAILPEEEKDLLAAFLETINQSFQIFSATRFPSALEESRFSRDLVFTLLVVTAKITGYKFASGEFDLDACIDQMLVSISFEADMHGGTTSLSQFRKACILTFYEFHQYPGRQAWMRIGKLTRMALWLNLDCLDTAELGHGTLHLTSQQDLEDWRLVWWCVYRLDSYASLSAGMPYMIDESIIGTALPWCQLPDCEVDGTHTVHTQPVYLPCHPDSLWKVLPDIAANQQEAALFNLHLLTTTTLRQVGRAIYSQRRGQATEPLEVLGNLERRLSVYRLALPASYFNPLRDASNSNESHSAHLTRLVTLFDVLMSRLLVSILGLFSKAEGDGWLLSWQQVLETCFDIASLSENWNSRFSVSADPAMSFIVFTALTFLELHKKSTTLPLTHLRANLERSEAALLLQLDQYAATWTLPKLLILSLKSFKELIGGPLSYAHIRLILSRFEAPMHPGWLRFLSSDPSDFCDTGGHLNSHSSQSEQASWAKSPVSNPSESQSR